MATDIAGYGLEALHALTPAQENFIRNLPKAELHAHLNGSIPLPALRALAQKYAPDSAEIHSSVRKLENVQLEDIDSFFKLFSTIYALTATPSALKDATRAVLAHFLDSSGTIKPQCTYLELRTTPRKTDSMTRLEYVQTVVEEVEQYGPEQAALIVSLDRRMDEHTMAECVDIAKQLKAKGRRVVGVDLCGDPMANDVGAFEKHFANAKAAGLRVTLHIAETAANSPEETLRLLSYKPDRLGHATFLNAEAIAIVLKEKIPIEICFTSNLLCKTVSSLPEHHIHQYLKANHPVVICTDDILPFKNSLCGEYALLMAPPPIGLGLGENDVARIANFGLQSRFTL